jgi:hypothetical protein
MEAVRLEIGVDWFSMSMSRDDPASNEWYVECLSIVERLEDEGNEAHTRQLLGFAGVTVGNLFIGAREDSYFAQFSGNNAQRYWKDCYRVGGHISRLDLQCTVFFAGDTANYGSTLYEDAANAAKALKGNRKRGVRRNEDNDHGYSVYIGSRDSNIYCCIYNKHAESKSEAYANSWRFELRFKNELATKVSSELFCRQADEDHAITQTIKNWLAERGVVAPWAETSVLPLSYAAVKGKTDKDTALWWLAEQVRPALDKARKLGYYAEACRALGLVEHPFYSVSRETGEVQYVSHD